METQRKNFLLTARTLEQNQAYMGYRCAADPSPAAPLKHPSAVFLPGVSWRRAFAHAEADAVITVAGAGPR